MSRWEKCAVTSCLRVARIKGLCQAHYERRELRPEVPIGLLTPRKLRRFFLKGGTGGK